MSSDNKRTDEYWIGVRDALRMVDSFNKWAARNPGRAKSLEDFIHDGLIAAAKRCESCLSAKLGLSFIMEEKVEAAPVSIESSEPEVVPPPGYDFAMDDAAEELFDIIPDTSFEIAVESIDYDSAQEIPIESDDSSFSFDSIERLEDEPMADIVIEGPQRDFTTDFVLVEPSPLEIDADKQKLEEPAVEEPLDEPDLEGFEVQEEASSEQEIVEKRPAFTWSEYEAAVAPTSEPEPLESEYDEYTTAEDDYIEEPLHEDTHTTDEEPFDEPPKPSEAPKVWSPYDEPLIDEEDIREELNEDEDSIAKMDDTQDTEPGEATTPITEPPAPPPPPESEEDEEERKRRARRLFFGA